MAPTDPAVTIIIPTRGLRERAASLRAAIESAWGQCDVRPVVIVVLNGPRRDANVECALRGDPRVTLVVSETASLPAALALGRAMVETPWFTALDDDDLLLPNALALRLRALDDHPDCAAVVTNGWRRTSSHDTVHVSPNETVSADPVRAMLAHNWLLPGSWLCRSDRVGTDVFASMPDFLECTYLGLRLASEHRIVWVDEPSVIYTVGSPGAESSSRAYVLGQVAALRRIIALPLPRDVRRTLRARIAGAYHAAANHEREVGALGGAWRWHVRSLLEPSGWRYAPFMRHLVRDTLRRLR
ncbi:MAG TPA: glycosyltransferase family A protein [Gemmatimonadaceae bacterium]|nr:glycosyltransferase family A protein [Gemmatimonadaceae bacterium]